MAPARAARVTTCNDVSIWYNNDVLSDTNLKSDVKTHLRLWVQDDPHPLYLRPDVVNAGQVDPDVVGQEDGAVGFDVGQVQRVDRLKVTHRLWNAVQTNNSDKLMSIQC